jgi:hypothetical protein
MRTEPRTIVTLPELAAEIGADITQLRYRIQTGQIPPGIRIGTAYCYTPDQARQIAEWWEARKRLVFSDD